MEGLYELAAISIAALAAFLSYFSSREARKSSKKAASAAQSISKMQYDLQNKDLKLQYHNEVRIWAATAIDCMGELIALCYLAPSKCQFSYRERQLILANKISSLTDSGRWFFPNDKSYPIGAHKDEAFEGYRHKVLDQLVGVFRTTLKINYESGEGNADRAKEIKSRKRRFTSLIQGYIKTRDWVEVIEQIDSQQ